MRASWPIPRGKRATCFVAAASKTPNARWKPRRSNSSAGRGLAAMSNAIRGSIALAELAVDENAAPGKNAAGDNGEGSTADFGATLSSLIAQSIAGKSLAANGNGSCAGIRNRGKQSAATSLASEADAMAAAQSPGTTQGSGDNSQATTAPQQSAPASSAAVAALYGNSKFADVAPSAGS